MRKFRLTMLAASAVMASGFALSAAKAQDIVIGVAGPLSGPNAAFGEQLKRGADQAVADINAAGGVLGKQIKVVYGDDASDCPKQGVSVANDLVNQGVVFVAGHFNSGCSIPASEIYAQAGVTQITPASTNPALTDDAAAKGYVNVNRVCGRDDAQGAVAGKWLADKYKGKAVAILHDNTQYGKGLADQTKLALNANGGKEAMYEGVNIGDTDFSALVTKMKANKIEAIYWGGLHTEGGLILKQARQQGLNAQFVSGDGIVSEEFWKITGDAGKGARHTFAPDPIDNPSAAKVVETFKAQNYKPEGYTLYSYAAVQVWAEAVKKAGSTDAEKVAKSLRGNTFDTVVGKLEYDNKGDIVNPQYVWFVWDNGTYAQEK